VSHLAAVQSQVGNLSNLRRSLWRRQSVVRSLILTRRSESTVQEHLPVLLVARLIHMLFVGIWCQVT